MFIPKIGLGYKRFKGCKKNLVVGYNYQGEKCETEINKTFKMSF